MGLTRGDKVIVVAGLVLFLAVCLPWFRISAGGPASAALVGWDLGFVWAGLPGLLGLAAAVGVVATRLGAIKLPALPLTGAQVVLAAGVLSAVLVVVKLLAGQADKDFGFEVTRSFGVFLGALAAIAFAAGGALKLQEGMVARPGRP